jgi:hypothetical protein
MSLATVETWHNYNQWKETAMMEYHSSGEMVVDLDDPTDTPDNGWVIDTHNNQYHGWGNPVRFAVCVRESDQQSGETSCTTS